MSAATPASNPQILAMAAPTNPVIENVSALSPDWESEKQLVSSLWKLQELEAKVHQLRTLLPDRLLVPLLPIVGFRKGGDGDPRSGHPPLGPEILQKQLAQSAAAGVAEIEDFKATWRNPEMKTIWDWMDGKLKESDGDFPQPVSMWERDYDIILKSLEGEESRKEQRLKQDEEQQERSRILSARGDRAAVIDSFKKRNLSGVQIFQDRNEAVITLVLLKAGMAFRIQEIPDCADADDGIPNWDVTIKPSLSQMNTKLDTAILSTLNDRPRKWDLVYLLDMICAYSDIKQQPCQKCNKLIDDNAKLPTIRRATNIDFADGNNDITNKDISWEAYHEACQ